MATFQAGARDLAKHITVIIKVKHFDEWKWRMRLGLWLIKLANWVMWTQFRIDADVDAHI